MSVENISSKHGREFIKSLDVSGLIDDGPWEMNFSTVSAPNLIKPKNSILPNAPAIGRVKTIIYNHTGAAVWPPQTKN